MSDRLLLEVRPNVIRANLLQAICESAWNCDDKTIHCHCYPGPFDAWVTLTEALCYSEKTTEEASTSLSSEASQGAAVVFPVSSSFAAARQARPPRGDAKKSDPLGLARDQIPASVNFFDAGKWIRCLQSES